MRFAWLMAAIAALWALPAEAAVVEFALQQPTPEAGLHQKYSLTGLTVEDRIFASGGIQGPTSYYWQSPGVLRPAGQAPAIVCFTESGQPYGCGDSYNLVSPTYPVKSITSYKLRIVGNDIYVDWTMFVQDVCASVPAAEQTGSKSDICGFSGGGPGDASLSFDVVGPSSQTFGYTVTDLDRNPVPEPATWALMILGIGLVGAAMRRRRAPSYARRTTRALVA